MLFLLNIVPSPQVKVKLNSCCNSHLSFYWTLLLLYFLKAVVLVIVMLIKAVDILNIFMMLL